MQSELFKKTWKLVTWSYLSMCWGDSILVVSPWGMNIAIILVKRFEMSSFKMDVMSSSCNNYQSKNMLAAHTVSLG